MFANTVFALALACASAAVCSALPAGAGRLELATTQPMRTGMMGALAVEMTRPEAVEERPRPVTTEERPAVMEEKPPQPAEVEEKPKPEEQPKPAEVEERPIREERVPVLVRPEERPAPGLTNTGYISGFFPGAFVSSVGGERHEIGYLRPTSNVRSPGRVYLAREGILAPERVINPSILSPGPVIRGQRIESTFAATRPRLTLEEVPEAN